MEKYINALIDILKDESSLIGQLIELSREKNKALTNIQIEDINEIVLKEQFVQGKIDKLEDERVRLNSEIAKALNVNNDTLTVTEILNYVDDGKKEELKNIRDEIKEKISEYKKINSQNIDIINNHLEYVNFMMHEILGEDEKSLVYGQKGETKKDGTMRKYYDNKA